MKEKAMPKKGSGTDHLREEKDILRVIMNRMPDMLFVPCPKCQGKGIQPSVLWSRWWEQHERDWREAIKDEANLPQEPEEIPCRSCKGGGTVLTRLGLALVNAMDVAKRLAVLTKGE